LYLRDVLRSPAQGVTLDDDPGGAWFSKKGNWVDADHCGSGLARESDVSGDIKAGCEIVFAGKPAPTESRSSYAKRQRYLSSLNAGFSLIFLSDQAVRRGSVTKEEAFQQAAQG
jgi:hypothetical protein